MPLVFSCITAHTPILISAIGKDKLTALDKTLKALERLEQELVQSHAETIVIISPHGETVPDALSINFHPKYRTNFSEFGDLATKGEWRTDSMLIGHIRQDFHQKHLPLVLTSNEDIDYGCAVPLTYLTKRLPQVRIVPLLASQLDTKIHFNFGRELKDELMKSTKKIAVIASVDLSHRVAENAPDGLSPRGVAFDDKVHELLMKHRPIGIMDIDEGWAKEAQSCGLNTLATFFGLLDEMHYQTTILSYEKPFGVGYLMASIKIS